MDEKPVFGPQRWVAVAAEPGKCCICSCLCPSAQPLSERARVVSMQVDQPLPKHPEERDESPGAPPTATRAEPTDIPTRKGPLLFHMHPASAPSDFAFARHSPMQDFSPYARHLACQVPKAPTLAEEAWRQHSIGLFTEGSTLRKVSASSSCSSPVAGSPASQDAGACRALVKRTSSHSAPRQVVVQLDSSLESRRLYTSPDGLLRASSGRTSGRSDVVSSRWGSPGTGGSEWAAFHRQKLIEHPDSSQVCL
jgi:hypothetical protein